MSQETGDAEKLLAESKTKRGRKATRLQSIIEALTELGEATVSQICDHTNAQDKAGSVAQTMRNNRKMFVKAGKDGLQAKWKLAD